jgi:hypothetical protein
MDKSDIVSTTIKNILFDDENLILETENGKFYSPIIKGSIQCNIETFEKKIVPLSYLEKGDLIKIKIKNNIILKIYINTKFEVISESSEEDYIS